MVLFDTRFDSTRIIVGIEQEMRNTKDDSLNSII